MSSEKRKPKVIHVDKVIIKANQVIIDGGRHEQDHDHFPMKGDHEHTETSSHTHVNPVEFDPWGFPIRRRPSSTEMHHTDITDS